MFSLTDCVLDRTLNATTRASVIVMIQFLLYNKSQQKSILVVGLRTRSAFYATLSGRQRRYDYALLSSKSATAYFHRLYYTVSQKTGTHMHHNSRKCGPILIILSFTDAFSDKLQKNIE